METIYTARTTEPLRKYYCWGNTDGHGVWGINYVTPINRNKGLKIPKFEGQHCATTTSQFSHGSFFIPVTID